MGEARAGDHVNHRKFPGRAGDSVGHKRGTLLVGDEHGANLGGEGERVVQFDVVGTRNSKREGDALVLQRTHDNIGTGHLHSSAGASSLMRWAARSASAMMVI